MNDIVTISIVFVVIVVGLLLACWFTSPKLEQRFKQVYSNYLLMFWLCCYIGMLIYFKYEFEYSWLGGLVKALGLDGSWGEHLCILVFTAKMLLIFLFLKGWLLKLFDFLHKEEKNNLREYIGHARPFYHYQDNQVGMHPQFKGLRTFFVIVCVILIFFLFGALHEIKTYKAFPAILVMFLVFCFEHFLFLQPDVLPISHQLQEEEPEDFEREYNYYNLWKRYQEEFSEHFLLAYHRIDPDPRAQPEPKQLQDFFEQDQDIILVNSHFFQIKENLKSILYHKILKGEKFLILLPKKRHVQVDKKRNAKSSKTYYKEVETYVLGLFEEIQELLKFCDKALSFERLDEYNFFAANPEEILDEDFGEATGATNRLHDFFNEIDNILMMDAQHLLAFYPSSTDTLFRLIAAKRGLKEPPRIFVFAEDFYSIQNSISNNFNISRNFEEARVPDSFSAEPYVLVWQYESDFDQTAFTGGGSTNLGAAACLSPLFINEAPTELHMIELFDIPMLEYRENLEKNKQNLVPKFRLKESIAEKCPMNVSTINLDQKEEFGAMLYDELNNFPFLIRKMENYGRSISFINVISKPYLLRNYFATNYLFTREDPVKPLPTILLNNCRVSTAIYLLERLVKSPVPEPEIIDLLSPLDPSGDTVLEQLQSLWKQIFKVDLLQGNNCRLSKEEIKHQNGRLETVFHIHISKESRARISPFQVYTFKDRQQRICAKVERDHLHQNFAVGQAHSFQGRTYRIRSIDESTNTVHVQAEESPVVISHYVQNNRIKVRKLHLLDDRPIRRTGRLLHFEGDFSISTDGYFEFTRGIHLDNSQDAYTPQNNIADRHYTYGRCLMIDFEPIRSIEFDPKINFSLALLLRELFRTLFPENYQYLKVSVPHLPASLKKDEELREYFTTMQLDEDLRSEHIDEHNFQVFIFEDSSRDVGLIGSILLHYKYIFRILGDFLHWEVQNHSSDLQRGRVQVLDIDDISVPMKYDNFLHYGRNLDKGGPPESIDINGLFRLIDQYFPKNKRTKARLAFDQLEPGVHIAPGKQTCDFCGKLDDQENMLRLDDGRYQCDSCKQQAVTSQEQQEYLIAQARQILRNEWNAHVPNSIPVEFTSAKAISKYSASPFRPTRSFDRRAVGLAFSGQLKIMVEDNWSQEQTLSTLLHEFTHIWQYQNLNMADLRKQYGPLLVEGHPCWIEVEFWNSLHHNEPGKNYNQNALGISERDDKYGRGYRLLVKLLTRDEQGNPFVWMQKTYGKSAKEIAAKRM